MSVSSSDLVVYGCANHQETDSGTQGGAIDLTVRLVFDDATLTNTLNTVVKTTSSSGADTTQTVTVYGRNSTGSIVSEALTLNGTNIITGAVTFERILKVVVSGSHTGTITCKKSDNTVFLNIESGVLTVRRPFYGASSDVSGGSTKNFYEKMFFKNNNAVNALLSAVFAESSDSSGLVDFDLESSVNGSNTSTSRLAAPSSGMLGSFTNSDKNVPGTDLQPLGTIGVWLHLTLAAGTSASKATEGIKITGSTT